MGSTIGQQKHTRRDPSLGMIETSRIKRIKREPLHIPLELLSDILSRLPARSVIRFRCVCKFWRSITHDSYFIDAHLDRAHKAYPPSILFFLSERSWDKYGITIIDHNSRPPKLISWGSKSSGCDVWLGNSCNGLLCIFDEDDDKRIKVLNPATGESLIIPEHTNIGRKPQGYSYLGFHPQTKEYKVIHFFPTSRETLSEGCEVHTLGTSSWRQLCIPDLPSFRCGHPIFTIVDGALYWMIFELLVDVQKKSILSFDLKAETFTLISFPVFKYYIEEPYAIDYHLVELQGSVCMTVNLLADNSCALRQMDIWMMTLNTDDNTKTQYEWARKYSVSFATGKDIVDSVSLFLHDNKILVSANICFGFDPDVEDEPSELIYYLSSKSLDGTVFYNEVKPAIPLVYHYLNEEYEIDEDFFPCCRIGNFQPFVHIESLVPLQSQ